MFKFKRKLINNYNLLFKLYEETLKSHGNDTEQVQMVRINASLELGHKYICRYKPLPSIIQYVLIKL